MRTKRQTVKRLKNLARCGRPANLCARQIFYSVHPRRESSHWFLGTVFIYQEESFLELGIILVMVVGVAGAPRSMRRSVIAPPRPRNDHMQKCW